MSALPGGQSRNGPALFALLGLGVLASRLPFLNNGFGDDGDASRVFVAARALATTGRYEVSRSLGYPLQEGICALLWRGGPAALNGASALMGTAAVVLFALVLRRLGARDTVLPALALAFVPVVYVNSVSAMDYVWALAFAMASLAALLGGQAALSGIVLALAIGCRVTSLVLLPPWLVLASGLPGLSLIRIAAPALAGGFLFYLPVLARYGPEIVRLFDTTPVPLAVMAADASTGVWGQLGCVAMAVALLCVVLARWIAPGPASIPPERAGRLTAACALALALDLALYLLHPNEGAYFLIGVPFVILLLGRLLNRRVYLAVCAALCLAPFVSLQDVRPAAGPILQDRASRRAGLDEIAVMRERARGYAPGSLLVVGRQRLPKLKAALPPEAIVADGFWSPASNRRGCVAGPVTFVSRMSADDLARAREARRPVFYLLSIRGENREATGLDLADPALAEPGWKPEPFTP
jgi:hypothetical protein